MQLSYRKNKQYKIYQEASPNLFYFFTISVYYIFFFAIIMLVYCYEFCSLHATLWSLYLT